MDFNNTGDVGGIGAEFDPEEFAQTLKHARVDSIVLMSKDIFGYSYYPTEVGTPHPAAAVPLQRQPLGMRVRAQLVPADRRAAGGATSETRACREGGSAPLCTPLPVTRSGDRWVVTVPTVAIAATVVFEEESA